MHPLSPCSLRHPRHNHVHTQHHTEHSCCTLMYALPATSSPTTNIHNTAFIWHNHLQKHALRMHTAPTSTKNTRRRNKCCRHPRASRHMHHTVDARPCPRRHALKYTALCFCTLGTRNGHATGSHWHDMRTLHPDHPVPESHAAHGEGGPRHIGPNRVHGGSSRCRTLSRISRCLCVRSMLRGNGCTRRATRPSCLCGRRFRTWLGNPWTNPPTLAFHACTLFLR